MKPTVSFLVSVARGAIISGILIYILPALAGSNAIWFTMPITELAVAIVVAIKMIQYTRKLSAGVLYRQA